MGFAVRGHLLAGFTVLVWGLTFISTKVLLKDFTPLEVMVDRFVVGTLVLLPFLWWSISRQTAGHGAHPGRMGWGRLQLHLVVVAALGGTLYFVLENAALNLAPAANVSLIVSTAPLFTALLGQWCGTPAPGRAFLIGFVLAVGGLMLVLWDELVLRLDLSGDLLALGAALTWAGYTLLMRRLLKQGISPLMLTLGVVAYTLFEALPVALWCGYALKADALMTPVNLLNLLFLGVIATSVCYFTWNRALEFIGPLRCTAYLYLQPVITAAGAALLISERLSMLKAAGMALVLLGLLCSERDPARRSHKKLPPAGSREHRAKDYGGRPREAHGEL